MSPIKVPKKNKDTSSFFHLFAKKSAEIVGNPWVFIIAVVLVIIWLISGPFFHFSDTWQLIINTSTTIITFLIVFLIQNTQNRDTEDMRIKLDEIIRAIKGAKNSIIDLENLSDEQLKELEKKYTQISKKEDK